MKKLFIFLFSIFFFHQMAGAHPLDISSTFLSFNKNYLNITTYFHSYEIEYLLNSKNIKFKSVYEYYDHENVIKKYLKENIKLELKNNVCEIENIELLKLEEYQILSTGIEVNYNFKCKQNINSGRILVSFFDNFPLQTNQMTFYDLNKNSSIPFESIVLTSDIKTFEFDLENKNKKCVIDSDGDSLSDEQELIHKTDPLNVDSDGDFYTDYEEIFNSFLPLDKKLGPNQYPKAEISKDILEKILKNTKTQKDCEKEISLTSKLSKDTGLLTSGFGNEYFVGTMKKISNFVNQTTSENIFYILLVVVGLGFVHAMGPGHSKSLLISYILDKNKSFFDGFLYIIIFTITHLIDIVLLFLVTKVIFDFYDISNYMLYIQRFSLGILLVFSLFLIYRAYKSIKIPPPRSSGTPFVKGGNNNIVGSIMLGFISGLAPCTFGWSIFLLLFSMGSLNLIIPMILALGLGIFLCLLLVLVLTFILRKKIFEKINIFSKYSSLFSSIVLFFLSIYLLTLVYKI